MSRLAAGVWVLCAACAAGPAQGAVLCTVLADGDSGGILQQQGDCQQRLSPASTFKIPLSLMGYDAGYLTDAHHPALPFREGYVALYPSWKSTIDPTSWMKNSVVWYSQQLTAWLGRQRLQRYVTQFDYGNRDLSGNPGMNDGLTQAWLSSSLRISPLEQVAFLQKLVNRQLPVSPRAYAMTARITSVARLRGGWDVHGKTGTGYQMKPQDGPDLKHPIGWFVGWASKPGHTVVFASVIADEAPQDSGAGPRARSALLQRLPGLLDSVAR